MIKNVSFSTFPHPNYPFNNRVLREELVIDLNQPITIFVGDNGAGKSTFLKALALYNN